MFAHFQMCTERLARIDEKLIVAEKLLEVLRESRAFYVDAQQNDVALMVDAMRSVAQRRREGSVLAPFEATLRYNAQIGDKGARTKRRLAAEAATAGAPKARGKAKAGRTGAGKKAAGAAKAAPGPAVAAPGPAVAAGPAKAAPGLARAVEAIPPLARTAPEA